MTTITVDELASRVHEVISGLARGGEPIAVTLDGAVVATLTGVVEPVRTGSEEAGSPMSEAEIDAFLAPWRRVWDAVGDRWPEGVSAVDAVREQRRG